MARELTRRPTPDLPRLLDRTPPFSAEAEMALLGSMILDARVSPEVMQVLSGADAFHSEAHATIYAAICAVVDTTGTVDLVQLSERLKDRDALKVVGGADYLVRLAEGVPSAANAAHYARIVHEKHTMRRLIEAAGAILYEAYHAPEHHDSSDVRQILDSAESMIYAVAGDEGAACGSQALSELLAETMDALDRRKRDGSTLTGLSTGYIDLDYMTCGLQAGEMIVVAARPSMGKTALALNLAEQVAGASGEPVGFFSLEMSRSSVAQRLLCAHAGVDSHRMRRNLLSAADFSRLADSCGFLAGIPLHVDDSPGLTIALARAKARRLASQHGIKCLFIDYMQLMSAPQSAKENRQAEVSAISRGIKALARELGIPVVCLAQLNRGPEQREGNRPRMSDLRESGSIEQDADVVMLLHREDYYHQGDIQWAAENPDKVGAAEIIIAKQRNGPTGTVALTWDSGTTRFHNYARKAPGAAA